MKLPTVFSEKNPNPTVWNITQFRARLHETTVAGHQERRILEEMRRDVAALPLDPRDQQDSKTYGRPSTDDVIKQQRLIEDLDREQASLEAIVQSYEREHPGSTAQERARSLFVAQAEQQRRYFIDAELDAAAGVADPEKLIPIRDELARREQVIIDFDETARQEAEHVTHLAKVVPDLKKRLLEQLAAFDRVTTEQQTIINGLRETYRQIDALKDVHGRVPGVDGALMQLALPVEFTLRHNYDSSIRRELLERWQRAYAKISK